MKEKTCILSKITIAIIAVTVFLMLVLGVSAQFSSFPQITVTLINQEPDPVAPGSTVEMKFRIENEGGAAAENTEAKLVLKYPFSLYGDQEIKSLGTIAGDQMGDIGVREEWKLLADAGATTGDHAVEFWYRIDKGIWIKAGDYTVTVRSRDAVLAINQIKTDRENIIPGTMTRVSFVLENLADNTLSDIKLNLNIYSEVTLATSVIVIELPFTPVGSGNEKTLKKLSPGESQEIVFDLFTDADAESKAYKVPYTLTYSDSSGINFSREGVVGLIVESTPDLSINLDSTQINTAGSKGRVEIKLVNKGFSDIKFLNVVLTETKEFEILSNPESYIGELDSDDYETADYTLKVSNTAKDQVTLPLTIEYRDANGKLYTDNIELSFKIGKKKIPVIRIIVWIVIIALIIGCIIYFRKRRKKHRKER